MLNPKSFKDKQRQIYNKKFSERQLRDIKIEHPLYLSLFSSLADFVFELPIFSSKKRVRLLECGCGQGIMAYHLQKSASVDYTGIDISEGALKIAKETAGNGTYIAADLENSSPDGKFDVIICKDVLHHLPAPERFLERAVNLLAEQGYVVIIERNLLSVQNILFLITSPIREWYLYRSVGRFYRKLFKEVGLRVIKEERFGFFPLDVVLGVRYSPFRRAQCLRDRRAVSTIARINNLARRSVLGGFADFNIFVLQ